MRHINFVLACILGLLLSAPAPASTPVEDPLTQILQEDAKAGPYGDGGG
ncbi:MAG: hypothetical protein V3T72_06775 [Thermoanaerobaculia bacterium]